MLTAASFVGLPSIGAVIERSRSNGLSLSRLSRRATGTPTVFSASFWRSAPHLRLGRPTRMAPLASSIKHPDHYTELRDAADFESIVTPTGYLSVCGFGSLLSERSARSTFPDLKNFRVAVLRGFRRVFAHVTPVFFERGIAKEETKEVACLSVEPCEGESLVITVFDITTSEVPSFIKREHEFRFLAVVPEALDGTPYNNSAVVCARYNDEEYFQIRCKVYWQLKALEKQLTTTS
ncbi:hypothetical protein HPP92_006907 [Vanilla planifolia]|uniref:Uncharacterized protein n=1 Tax=Vanilla planifolia TaxID=51239 RepID=A0A835V9J9_VANPL|nr:hypothetical protein HPP92_006907 [Vanilla planifolia]